MPATPQETAARRYRIEKYLTEGGMGAIYIGKKLGPGGFAKEVVLKQLLPEYTSRPEFRDLFFREAKISATLDHANIVHTFDLVESDQSLFIVMEYVRGADLRTIIRRARQRKRELSPAAAVHVALEILAGLSYAHARRDASGKSLDIIHRDVSPSNILCSVQGAAKLSDFGIAKASTYSSVFYRVRGKVGYMSPEQARNLPIDHRCDLYSLSVCLYESLSGERLFVGDLNTPADEIYGIPILPPSRKRPGLPKALDDVLERALATNVEARYQSASELADALRTVAHRTGLAFSAPELAAHLRDILGSDPERWLRDEPAVAPASEPQAPSSDLVGTEASSIGIVNIAQDEPPPSVLSPKAVSGSKDFDLDSMLNDEATRPGSDPRPPAPLGATPVVAPPAPQAPASPPGLGQAPGPVLTSTLSGLGGPGAAPPPAWTRGTSPFPLATPKPMRTAPPPTVIRPALQRASLPGVPAAPPVPPGGSSSRPLPRATLRTGTMPPPFSPGARVPPPPPPPPHVPTPPSGHPAAARGEMEDASPARPPPSLRLSRLDIQSVDIEDVLTPRPVPGGSAAASPPAPAAPLASPHRAMPAPYPSSAVEAPVVLDQPPTFDFSDAVTGLLPETGSGPPAWLAVILIVGAAIGGALLARKATSADVAALLTEQPPVSERAASVETPPAGAKAAAPPSATAQKGGGSAKAEAPADSPRGDEMPARDRLAAQAGEKTVGGAAAAAGAPDASAGGKRHGGKHAKRAKHPKKHRGY